MKKFVCLIIVLCFFVSINAVAGNLEPSGPPTSGTMKPLNEVEPRTPISQSDIPKTIDTSGSYYLTEDVTAAGTAITINVDDVTIDLAGFSLIGPSSGTTNYGVYLSGRKNVEIRNGTIRNFYYGINEEFSGQSHRVIDVRAISNRRDGIYLNGNGHLVKNCMAYDNGASHPATSSVYGIRVGNGSIVADSTANYNGNSTGSSAYGIHTGNGCTVTGNTAILNGNSAGGSAAGIYTGIGCTVTGNTASTNGHWTNGTTYGIRSSSGCTVTNNSAYDNGSWGVNVRAIYADSGSAVIGNTAYNNGNSATGSVYGFYIQSNSFVDRNVSLSNDGNNMYTAPSCTIGLNHNPAP